MIIETPPFLIPKFCFTVSKFETKLLYPPPSHPLCMECGQNKKGSHIWVSPDFYQLEQSLKICKIKKISNIQQKLTHFNICCHSELNGLNPQLIQNDFHIKIVFRNCRYGSQNYQFLDRRKLCTSWCNTLYNSNQCILYREYSTKEFDITFQRFQF